MVHGTSQSSSRIQKAAAPPRALDIPSTLLVLVVCLEVWSFGWMARMKTTSTSS